jgi:hypothetical protein
MELDHATAHATARRYFGTTTPLKRLGWGIGGVVYLSPDANSAVKVHHHQESFETELRVYRKLKELRITQLHGLTIPKLRDAREDCKLLCMDFVNAPFLLDFAGVLFSPPDFPDDAMQHWHGKISEAYGPNAHVAYAVYNSLQKYGMYYVDFRKTNLNLDGLPGLEPYEPSDDDETW